MAIHLRTVARHTWRTVFRVTLMLLIIVVLITGMLLGTEGGRIALFKQGMNFARLWSGEQITATGVRSPGLGSWVIDEINWRGNPRVSQLQVRDVRLKWRWRFALQNRWWFERIEADALNITLAESRASSGDNFSLLYDIWPLIPAIRVERLHLDEVRIERPRYQPLVTRFDAQAELNWGALPLRFLLSMDHQPTGNTYAMQLSADAINRVRLQGTLLAEPGSVWAQWMHWELPQPAQASWNINIDYSQIGQLAVDIDEWQMPWQNHQLEAEGRVLYDVDDVRLQFEPLDFLLDGDPAQIEGWIEAQASQLRVNISQWLLDPFTELAGFSDLTGNLTAEAVWLGGWRQPRLTGELQSSGKWREYPYTVSMSSVAERNLLNIEEGELLLANNDLALTGNIDWITEELDFTVRGEVNTDPVLRELMPSALDDVTGTLNVSAFVTGPVSDPQVGFDLTGAGQWRDDPLDIAVAGRWQQSTLTLDRAFIYSPIIHADGRLSWQPGEQALSSDWAIRELRTDLLDRIGVRFPVAFEGSGFGQLQVGVSEDGLDVQGDLNVQGLWQDWPLNAQLNIDQVNGQSLRLAESRMALGQRETSVAGLVDWSQQRLDLTFEHQDWPLSTLPPWLKIWPEILSTLDGDWTGQTRVYGPWNRPNIASDSQLSGSWFGDALELSLQTEPQTADVWQVPSLQASWLGADWTYQGAFRPWQLELNGQVSVNNLHARQLPKLSERFTGQVRSLPESMDVKLDADMALRGRIVAPNLDGKARLYGELDNQPFDFRTDIGYLDVSYIDIAEASGQWSDGQWVLDGLVDWRLGQVALFVETQSPNVDYLVPWLQLALENHPNFQWLNGWEGSLNGQLQVDNRTEDWLIDGDLRSAGRLFDDDYNVHWEGKGRLRQALEHSVEANWGAAEATARLSSDAEELKGKIDVQWLNYEQLRSFVPQIPEWMLGLVNSQIDISGRLQQLDITARLATTGQIDTGEGHRFSANAELTAQQGQWEIGQTVIDFPDAVSMTVAGRGEGTRGEIEFEGLLPDTQYFIGSDEIGPGEAAFKLTASGDLLAPELTGNLEWRAANWPITVTADLSTEDDHYQMDGALYSDGLTRIKTQLNVPVQPLVRWPADWKQTPAALNLAVNSPFSVLDPFIVDQPDLRIEGDLQGQLAMTGTILSPQWQGSLRWQNGQFEHAGFGSLVDDINLRLVGDQQNWQLSLTGTDGDDGRISLSGDVLFDEPNRMLGHSLDMTASFTNAGLLNRAQMDAAVSGDIDITGSYRNLLLSGSLKVEPLNLQSDTFLWDGAPQLNIVSAEKEATEISDFQSPAYWPDGELDLLLTVENRANLYGQGISAELAGELSVTDNLYEPVMAGRFNLVRGTYTGLGRVFALTSGSVQIQNNQLVLDIRGEHQTQLQVDGQTQPMVISLRIVGTQDELSLSLTSDAGLEQDELLAQLLFGKIVADLDVFQAIQLANVVNKLRTGDSGFDLIGATRDTFDLDSLVFDTESDEQGNLQFNVSAGKYLNDFLYLEVEQDVGTEQEFRGSIQYQVTPNTNLELYTQGEGGELDDSGIELNWSWDY